MRYDYGVWTMEKKAEVTCTPQDGHSPKRHEDEVSVVDLRLDVEEWR